jgi:L,D-transpeptidase catalytic domain/LysM domain
MKKRHRRLSQQIGVALFAVGMVAGGMWYFRTDESARSAEPGQLLPDQAGPQLTHTARPVTPPVVEPNADEVIGALNQPSKQTLLVSKKENESKPATAPSMPEPAKLSVLPTSIEAFAQAQAKRDAGDILAARSILNDQLVSGKLTHQQDEDAKAFIRELNQRIVFSNAKLNADAYNARVKVESGHSLTVLARQFDITPEFLGRINGINDPRRLRAGAELKAIKGPFHAVVSKTHFTIDFYLGAPGGQGSTYITTYRVGLGSDASTPTGTWLVAKGGKLVNPKFWGAGDLPPMAADDPKNPLGERWLQLEGIAGEAVGKEGYGIHGTIDPDSIGKNMSMGCIRLLDDDVKMVYDLLTDGKSKVVVVP